jgi:hypothetical protein
MLRSGADGGADDTGGVVGAAARLGDGSADAAGAAAVALVSLEAAAAGSGEVAGGWLPPHAANDDNAT